MARPLGELIKQAAQAAVDKHPFLRKHGELQLEEYRMQQMRAKAIRWKVRRNMYYGIEHTSENLKVGV